jgi:hypothetical protein
MNKNYMAISRPFAYNPGSTLSGTEQYGTIAVGTGDNPYDQNYGGLQWWNGPDEELGYCIGTSVPAGDQPTPTGNVGTVQFWRTNSLDEEQFVILAETVTGQNFTGSTEAKEYLNNNGYWTSFSKFIVSAGRTTTGGYQVGAVIDKDMSVSNWSYESQGTPNGATPNLTASYWSDWGEDIFDSWGYFYLFDPASSTYLGLQFNDVNLPDGQFATQTFNLNGRIFSITQGYPVQGIFKFEIRCNDDQPFVFGEAGNMGSDGSTANVDQSYPYTLNGVNLTLWYNENYQTNNVNERLYSYYIPFVVEENATKTYTDFISGSDNLYLYSVECTNGITVYHSKQFDTKEWVVYDLKFGE